ncbi:hypothetical protein BDV27DRAFT_159806 [Aspergillus caelatus]|uniref:Uncharacterized protein n=1 Tax=Aspergillus caelatus TaxID=61420 RepID=A0A5N6ZXQ4_9EURO|nr:uncharacterized protein BDV27DRAFT_159806 [Aspergillus caelatus]KAE8362394.1 hypothetical protein BDV27DRAFT_159806 [Aspergillus caelatus]
MSGIQDSKWANAPTTAAAAGAGGDPNRGGRRGRDGKKPPTDRVTVKTKPWVCRNGCGTQHPGKVCPMTELGQQLWTLREQYLAEQDRIVAAAITPFRPASNPPADLSGASAPSRRRRRGAPSGANTPTPGGSSIRPLPAAADGNNNSSAGNRNEGGERQLNHQQRRSRARLQAYRARQRQQQQQHTSTGDTQDTEMATAPAGENQPETISAPAAAPGAEALEGEESSVQTLCVRSKDPS